MLQTGALPELQPQLTARIIYVTKLFLNSPVFSSLVRFTLHMNGLAIFTYATQHLVQSQWSVTITIWFPNTFAALKGSDPLTPLRRCFWSPGNYDYALRFCGFTYSGHFTETKPYDMCLSRSGWYFLSWFLEHVSVYVWRMFTSVGARVCTREYTLFIETESLTWTQSMLISALGILSLCSKPLCPPGIFVGSRRSRLQPSCLNIRHFKHRATSSAPSTGTFILWLHNLLLGWNTFCLAIHLPVGIWVVLSFIHLFCCC